MKPAKQTSTNQPEISLPSHPLQPDPNRLIRLKEVLQIVPVSASCWWNWVATSRAPRPVHLGKRCTCWRYTDVITMADKEE